MSHYKPLHYRLNRSFSMLNLDGLDAVLQPGALRGKDELVRPQRVDDARGDEGPNIAGIDKLKFDQ